MIEFEKIELRLNLLNKEAGLFRDIVFMTGKFLQKGKGIGKVGESIARKGYKIAEWGMKDTPYINMGARSLGAKLLGIPRSRAYTLGKLNPTGQKIWRKFNKSTKKLRNKFSGSPQNVKPVTPKGEPEKILSSGENILNKPYSTPQTSKTPKGSSNIIDWWKNLSGKKKFMIGAGGAAALGAGGLATGALIQKGNNS